MIDSWDWLMIGRLSVLTGSQYRDSTQPHFGLISVQWEEVEARHPSLHTDYAFNINRYSAKGISSMSRCYGYLDVFIF